MNVPFEPVRMTTREHQIEQLVIGFIVASIVEAEAATALVAPLVGIILHGVILLTAINIYLLIPFLPHRKVLLPLLLLPVLRIISLTLPIAVLPQLYWYAAIGLPLMISTILVSRILHPPARVFQLHFRHAWEQVTFGIVGIPLGIVAYRLIPQSPLIDPNNRIELGIALVSLVIFSAFLDEVIFRFLIQSNLATVFGKWGILICGLLYASVFFSTLSLAAVLFWGLLGLGFSFWVRRTQSIYGTIIAHSLILIGAMIVCPLILH